MAIDVRTGTIDLEIESRPNPDFKYEEMRNLADVQNGLLDKLPDLFFVLLGQNIYTCTCISVFKTSSKESRAFPHAELRNARRRREGR